MTFADLYLDEINFLHYFNKQNCVQCGFSSCREFIDALRSGLRNPRDCSLIDGNEAYALEAVQKIKDLWPEVPLLLHPRPGPAGLVELNNPSSESPVIISGNNEYTEQVLLTVLSTTISPFFVIFVDTDGNTVDMSMVYQTLTAERIHKAIKKADIEGKAGKREMLIPGLASTLKEDIVRLTGWHVEVGPKCAAELPLFLSHIWIPPE